MKSFRFLAFAGALFWCAIPLRAADWNEWLGPNRNSLAPSSPKLADSWPQGGPVKLWESEKIPSDMRADFRSGQRAGGWGSAVVADGRAYVFVNLKTQVPKTERTITERDLVRMGWSKTKLPPDLLQKSERARLSRERAELGRKQLRRWVNDWMKAHMDAELKKRFGRTIQTRLLLGNRALPFDVLDKLETVLNRSFPSQEALQSWLAENGVSKKHARFVMRNILSYREIGADVIWCIAADSGKTLWKTEFPGRPYGYPASSTPCIANGRCYVVGSASNVYCFNAGSGKLLWRAKTKADPGWNTSSSFIVVGRIAAVLARELTAFDAGSGELLWTQNKLSGKHNSAVSWRSDGSTFLICNSETDVACVEPENGKILWRARGGGYSTAAVAGDRMVVLGNKSSFGMTAYAISRSGAQKLWSIPFVDRGASPVIYNGHVYAVGGRAKGKFICVELDTGKICWEQRVGNTEFSTPVVADGKLIAVVGDSLWLVSASPEKYVLLDKATLRVTRCTSPAFVDGRVYLRLKDAIACYDLTPRAQPGD